MFQTAGGSSSWSERSPIRKQYHGLECCYFWVSNVFGMISVDVEFFGAFCVDIYSLCDFPFSPEGTPFEDGKLFIPQLRKHILNCVF